MRKYCYTDGMGEFGEIGEQAVSTRRTQERKIVKRPNGRGVVPQKRESAVGKMVRSKTAGLVLAGAAVAGGGTALATADMNADSGSGVKVTVLSQDENNSDQANHNLEIAEKENESINLFDTVFHDLDGVQQQEARARVDEFKAKILAKVGYEKEHIEIPTQYRSQIEQTAKAYGLTFEMLQGIISIENGGGTDIENPYSGAVGVAQFLPDTARQYGLHVNSEFDERKDPVKSIAAAGKYLEDHKILFDGDEGITMWSYHAGEGNVYKALRYYFLDRYGEDIGDYAHSKDITETKEIMGHAFKLMEQDKLDLYKLLTNQSVIDNVTSKLDDYSDTYVFQIVALSEILSGKSERVVDIGNGLILGIAKNPGQIER